ncbi:uncharacterized protein LOC123700970 [Colias croceus]|uniref:uncharacterized protein LOC123700970 n=1 Tax=Colias crocea TaxID=72248 RepID=UPI001E27D17B|nr:uncharacterized protein LOC123700970 [Colias croceus]
MLLNEFSKTSRDQQIWIMILLLQCYPKGLFSVYTAVAFFLKSGLVGTIPFLMQIKDTLFMLFVPAYLSESINTEYEKILKILWKQTLFCNDKDLLLEKRHAYLYVKNRPVQFNVCKGITVNLSLPIGFIGISISHLVVLLQFRNVRVKFS